MGSNQKNTLVAKFGGESTVKAGTIIVSSKEQMQRNTAKTWLQSSKGSPGEHKSKD